MERLTRPTVKVDETAAKYMAAPGSIPADLRIMNDRLLDLVINGPTLNGVNKDVLRQLIRQLYAELKLYEDTGVGPEGINVLKVIHGLPAAEIVRICNLYQLEKEGRLVVLPFAPGTTLVDRSELERPALMKNFRLAVAYDHNGIVFHQPLNIFLENVRRGYFAQVSEEAERALEGVTDNE